MHNGTIKKNLFTPATLGLVGALIALVATGVRGFESTTFSDAGGILEQAHGMTRGWTFMLSHPLLQSNPLHSQFPSGFPAILAFTFLITNSTSLLLVKILLAIGHGFSTYLVARIGQQMELKRIFWVLAAIGFSFDPFILSAATDIQTESITTLVVLWWGFLYLTPATSKRQTLTRIIGFPITGFIAITVRPNIIIPFLLVAVIVFISWHRDAIRVRFLIVSTSIFVALLALFEVFLTRLYNGFVFLAPNGGLNAVLTCRTEFIGQYLGIASNQENTRVNHWYYTYLEDMTTKILVKQEIVSVPALNRELYDAGISSCLADPISSIAMFVLKVFALWRPFTVVGAYGLEILLFSILLWVPMTIAAGWFMANSNLSKPNRLLRKYFAVLAFGFTLSLLPTATQIRHRIAFAEPFYWLFLAFVLSQILTRWTQHQRKNSVRRGRKEP